MDNLNVDVKPKDNSILAVRYSFADWFRNEYINSHLSNDIVNSIATLAVGIAAFLDSLMVDLVVIKRDK